MIFDNPFKRRKPQGGGGTPNDDLDLDTLKAKIPDVDQAEADIDAAIRKAERQLTEKEERSSCGCW